MLLFPSTDKIEFVYGLPIKQQYFLFKDNIWFYSEKV